MLLDYFTRGTEDTITGAKIGIEIETDFVMEDGSPLPAEVTPLILQATTGRPSGCEHKLELGRQKIELSIAPQPTFEQAYEMATTSLAWLYNLAATYGARPLLGPEINYDGDLLLVQEERDEVWVALDGRRALEHLCRCSSVQFTIDVNPADAITVINRLWEAELHRCDYQANDIRWRRYMSESVAKYRPDRYGGPCKFTDLSDYCQQMSQHDVVMHQGQPVRRQITEVEDLNIDLFLRSVWWHFRLRRFGNTLALEIRPFSRRDDGAIQQSWEWIKQALDW